MRFYTFFTYGTASLSLVPSDLDYFQDHFVGTQMADSWRPPTFSVVNKSRPITDFIPWFLSVMVVTDKAMRHLEPILAPFVEVLPLAVIKNTNLFAINVTEVVDCLDRGSSGVNRSSEDPDRIISIDKFVFDPKRLKSVPIFKVPEDPMIIFVSELFAETVLNAKLRGAGFDNPEDVRYVKPPAPRSLAELPAARDFKF